MRDTGNPNQNSSTGQTHIREGLLKKGGVNQAPSTPRPAPPAGQGGSDSSGQGGDSSSNQGSSGDSSNQNSSTGS